MGSRIVVSTVSALGLLAPVAAAAGGFLQWWENWGQRCTGATHPTAGEVHVNLARSRARPDLLRSVPLDLRPGIGEVHVLWSEGNRQIMLALPPDLADSAEDPEACCARSSWLTISPGKTWSPINLNPFCGDIYGPREVDSPSSWIRKRACSSRS